MSRRMVNMFQWRRLNHEVVGAGLVVLVATLGHYLG